MARYRVSVWLAIALKTSPGGSPSRSRGGRAAATADEGLLERLDLTATVVTADVLHTQREHAEWLVTVKQAAYVLLVKANQPALHHQLEALPWREVPVADHTRDRGHHRMELRRLQVITVAGLDFPHATRRSASPAGSGPCTAGAGGP